MSNKSYLTDRSFYNFEDNYNDTNNQGQTKKKNNSNKANKANKVNKANRTEEDYNKISSDYFNFGQKDYNQYQGTKADLSHRSKKVSIFDPDQYDKKREPQRDKDGKIIPEEKIGITREEAPIKIEDQNRSIDENAKKINKKNLDYYNVYKDFNETRSNTDLIYKLDKAPFLFWNEHKQKYFQRYNNDKQCAEPSCQDADNVELVKEAFFLRENIEIVQNMIIKNVAKKSNYLIPKQKDEDIILLMNGIYHDYARNLPYNLKEQIQELDERTVNFITPWLINEVEAYQKYLIDSNAPLRPPELPINITKPRKESLPSVFPR